MGEIVADIARHTTAENPSTNKPVEPEDRMGQAPEGNGKDQKQRRRHDQPKLVHGQVMVDSMHQEMQRNHDPVIGHFPMVDC